MKDKEIVFVYDSDSVGPRIIYVDSYLTEFNDEHELIHVDKLAKVVDGICDGLWDSFSVEVDDGIHRKYNKFDRARD